MTQIIGKRLIFPNFASMIYYRNLFLPFIACFIFVACGDQNKEILNQEDNEVKTNVTSPAAVQASEEIRSIKVRNIGPLYQVFNDSNHVQLAVAQKLGIDPIEDLNKAYFMRRPIVKIESNKYYQVDSLTHSVPYLVPEAADLLQEIGKNFIDSLHNRGCDNYKVKVTSMLRTPDLVQKLRKVNVNATDSSTHQYATTFDISYTNFYCLDNNKPINQGDLKNLLGEVLLDLRKQGKCFVKYEHKTACFHVTVNKD